MATQCAAVPFAHANRAAGRKSLSCKQRYNKCPDLYLYLYILDLQ